MAKQKMIVKRNASSGPNIRTTSEKVILSIFFVLFVAYAVSLFFPVIWTGYNSLKTGREFNDDQFSFPTDPHWQNYSAVFTTKFPNKITIPFAVFNTVYEICPGATESIEPTAFDGALSDDIRALINHDSTLVLGRTKAGT